jgi:type III restriction enzyme
VTDVPRNAVENPILNNPFAEPARHYDFSGVVPRIVDGRRPAGYYGLTRTDRGGDSALTQHALIPLPLVNEIRARVRAWRERRYPNVTATTRDLLDHWNRPDRRPIFFCQREAAETIIWLVEATAADRQGIDVPADEPNDLESLQKGYGALRRYCSKMATGSGKTIVMAMLSAWSILNKVVNRQDARFSDTVLVVGPNLTVKERLGVLVPQVAGNYYETFDLVPASYRDLLARGRVFVTNWHVFLVKDDSRSSRRSVVQRGRESDAAFCKRVLGRELGGASGLLVLNDEAHHAYRPAPPSSPEEAAREREDMTADERKEADELAEEATVWVGGLDRINKVRGIRLMVDVSATPFYLKGSGHPEGSPLPWIVSDFGLVDAIESGICKVPRIPIADDSGRPDPKYFHLWREIMTRLPSSERETVKRRARPDSVWREAQGALTTLAGKWQVTAEYFAESHYPVPPALIVVAANTNLAEVIADSLREGEILDDLAGEHTFAIDSKVLAEAEAAVEGDSKDARQEFLRLKTATVGKASWPDGRPPPGFEDLPEPPGKNVRCVVSVGMLTEGWDAQNVTQILGLRAFRSQLLCEQVVGRGLRRMNYEVDPGTGRLEPEYCDVFGIPFEVIPVQGTTLKAVVPPPPSTLVQALDERKALAMEWPRVEGYVVDVRQRIRCDVDRLPPLVIEPTLEPTQVLIKSQMGWVPQSGLHSSTGELERLTRERFYEEHRLQRTMFEIARDVTEVLAGGTVALGSQPVPRERIESARLLFPQVLAVVTRYVDEKVTRKNVPIEELALARYRNQMVERLLNGIEADTDDREPPLLPRIDRQRPTGSTAGVQFRTTKPTKGTHKSHISHVVLDSSWENMAAFHFELSPHVLAYAKNDRLDFEILYEFHGTWHRYIPDYLVRIETLSGAPITVILEVKGLVSEQDRAKFSAAERWTRAVNYHGGFGPWAYMQSEDPAELPARLERIHRLGLAAFGSSDRPAKVESA